MHLTVEFSVWLGFAGFALIWANLGIWHTRHILNRLRQDLAVPEGSRMPATCVTVPASSVTTP